MEKEFNPLKHKSYEELPKEQKPKFEVIESENVELKIEISN